MKKMMFSIMAGVAFCAVMGLGNVALAKDSKTESAKTAPAKADTMASKAAWDVPLSKAERDNLRDLRGQLKGKRESLRAVFDATEFDEAKAKAIYAEMQGLITEIAQKRFDAAVAYKKANMDWKPGDKPVKKGKKGMKKPVKEQPAAEAAVSPAPAAPAAEKEAAAPQDAPKAD